MPATGDRARRALRSCGPATSGLKRSRRRRCSSPAPAVDPAWLAANHLQGEECSCVSSENERGWTARLIRRRGGRLLPGVRRAGVRRGRTSTCHSERQVRRFRVMTEAVSAPGPPAIDRLRPLTKRILASLPGSRVLWIVVWAFVPWVNAGINLLVEPEDRSAVWEQGRLLVVLNYAAVSLDGDHAVGERSGSPDDSKRSGRQRRRCSTSTHGRRFVE